MSPAMKGTPCPTPRKRRFSTLKEAEKEANLANFIYEDMLYPYKCRPCGGVHLSSKQKSTQGDSLKLIDLLKMDHYAFNRFVRKEAQGNVSKEEAILLRSNELVKDWVDSLGILRLDLQSELSELSGKNSQEVKNRRKKVNSLDFKVGQRIIEAKGIIRRKITEGYIGVHESYYLGFEAKIEAGNNAIHRLINNNRPEFTRILMEEFHKVGLKYCND